MSKFFESMNKCLLIIYCKYVIAEWQKQMHCNGVNTIKTPDLYKMRFEIMIVLENIICDNW